MKGKKGIGILLVDDHQIIKESVQLMLSGSASIAWTAVAGSGEEALRLVRCLKPDIVITDISMPGMNGIELTEQICKLSAETRVLVLTMYIHDDFVFQAIRAGAQGVLSKQDTTRQLLLDAVEALMEGREFFSPGIYDQAMRSVIGMAKSRQRSTSPKIPSLTAREKEVLRLYVAGLSNQEIAERLSISIRTVETHKANMMQKFNFKSTVEMIKFALRNNLVPLE